MLSLAVLFLTTAYLAVGTDAFGTSSSSSSSRSFRTTWWTQPPTPKRTRPLPASFGMLSPRVAFASTPTALHATTNTSLKRVDPDMEGVPVPFVDFTTNSFIECYVDSVAMIDNVEYTVGVPCDYSVALCYFDEQDELVPVELDDFELMDDIFPVAEAIVAEEFGEELVLQRTPQTLTLVGELEDDDDDDDDDDDEEQLHSQSGDDDDDDDEEVEVLISFEHRGREFNLVRILDPILLVGKKKLDGDDSDGDKCLLLSKEESDRVMPLLEDMFLEYNNSAEDEDDMMP
jgi:hypothetical protein